MGAFFTSYQVRADDAANCAKVLAASIESRAVITDSKNGWVTIYDEKSDSQDTNTLRSLAAALSKRLKTAVIATIVHDSDIFLYLFYDKGKFMDQFDSKPDYFGPVSDSQKKEWAGNFAKLLPLAAKGMSVADFKRVLGEEHVFEEERAGKFAKLMGIDPARAQSGFKYIQETKHSFKPVYAKGYSQDQALLVEAVSHGDAAKVSALLEKGASPHQKDRFGQPLLVVAGRCGKLEIVRGLLAHGADMFAEVPGGGDALWIAAAKGHDEIVQLLLEKGQGNSKLAAHLPTAFDAAVMAGHANTIKHLIRAGADLNAKGPIGQPPLMLASMRGQEFLWEATTKQPYPNRPGEPRTDWKEVVLLLLESGAQLPFPVKDGPIDINTLSADQKSKLADSLLLAGSKIKLPEGFKIGGIGESCSPAEKPKDDKDSEE